MAAASCLLTEDQFLCSICLDVFADPVSIPCGHNFCRNCITQQWNISVQCQCPVCKIIYNTRPELQINTFISEMAAQFKQSDQQKTSSSSSSEQQVIKPGEVPCDVCTGTKLKALKSCLLCLTSYCETHLAPHLTKSGLKKHHLIDPVEKLEERMCEKHSELLELFCQTDQMCVRVLCTNSDHKTHDVVPLKEEYEGKNTELKKTEAEIQQMIQKRRLKIQEIKVSVELCNKDADREIEEGVQVFTALKESVERVQAEVITTIKEKQRTTEKQAEDLIKELEQEIFDLKKRNSEVEQLLQSEDHLHLLHSSSSICTSPSTNDWTKVIIHPTSYEGTVVRFLHQLESTLTQKMQQLFEDELRRVQRYAVTVTLDPDVVHPKSIESKDQQVSDANKCRCVLSKKGFSSGRFYFEAEVNTLSSWTLGVARNLTNIKSQVTLSPKNGFWTVCFKWKFFGTNKYFAAADPPVCFSLKSQPKKVGVFVDYEEGLVSFYDADTAALIYSFTGCSFTEEIYPFFTTCDTDGIKIHGKDEGCVLQ